MILSQQEKIYQIALSKIQGLGTTLFRKLLEEFSSAKNVFENTKAINKIPNIKKSILSSIANKETVSKAEVLLKQHVENKIEVVCFAEDSYPSRLKEIQSAPPVLYCSNKINFNSPKVIGIVGARNATPYGKEKVEKLIRGLANHGPVIVSGLAYGIDIYAHQAAIKHDLSTIGILGGGLDAIYPACHTKTAYNMMKKGGLASEQAIGTLPERHYFPLRNRIIAGISDVVIIIEASKNSGALITAKLAHEYDREVFALPGCVGKASSEGCNDLIKNHQAHLLTSFEDVELIMNWQKVNLQSKAKKIKVNSVHLSDEENVILKAFAELYEPFSLDVLTHKTKINKLKLSSIMLDLELKKVIEVVQGYKYKLRCA
ncbi:MAG: DNA-processing protein DprA [Bacteroidota bacterium]